MVKNRYYKKLRYIDFRIESNPIKEQDLLINDINDFVQETKVESLKDAL